MVDNVMAPGTYEADFNGNGLASGVYFYRMSVDGQVVSSKKMMLLK